MFYIKSPYLRIPKIIFFGLECHLIMKKCSSEMHQFESADPVVHRYFLFGLFILQFEFSSYFADVSWKSPVYENRRKSEVTRVGNGREFFWIFYNETFFRKLIFVNIFRYQRFGIFITRN